jgi:uncharacterized phosphosugar-binding protein
VKALDQFFQAAQSQLAAIERTQREKIEQAADWCASALLDRHLIYAFGSGHSHALAEEIFYRAGGPARVVPILDENLMVHKSAIDSTDWERKEGYAAKVLLRYPMATGDVLFLISNSGRNAVPIEMAMEAKKRGAKVIAVTSSQYSSAFPSRHSSGKKLPQIADLTIDNCGPIGDAVVQIPNMGTKVGPTSTISSAFILHGILVEAVEKIIERGGKPEVWGSANSEATNNEALLAKYKGEIPHL